MKRRIAVTLGSVVLLLAAFAAAEPAASGALGPASAEAPSTAEDSPPPASALNMDVAASSKLLAMSPSARVDLPPAGKVAVSDGPPHVNGSKPLASPPAAASSPALPVDALCKKILQNNNSAAYRIGGRLTFYKGERFNIYLGIKGLRPSWLVLFESDISRIESAHYEISKQDLQHLHIDTQ